MTTNHASRRQFLVAGSASLIGAAALAACSSDSVVNSSGTAASTSIPPTAPPTTADAKALALGQQVLRTATSLELAAAAFYDDFVAATYLDSQAITLGRLFGEHHKANAEALGTLTVQAGGKTYDKPNRYLQTELIEPLFKVADAARSSEKLISLATNVEDVAASNCVIAVGSFARTPERVGMMEIGGANARHAALWRLVASPGDFSGSLPDALYSVRNALGAAAQIS